MKHRSVFAAVAASLVVVVVAPVVSITAQAPQPAPRAIRRDVPMTNTIRRAWDAGTRDASGRPGPNYWQLQVDYTINARLDPAAGTITGSETVTLHNNSPQQLNDIYLRLDHNIYRGLTPKLSVPAEETEGCVLTKVTVDGASITLVPRGGGAGPGRAANVDTTLARITPPKPVAPRSNATLEIEWRTKLPGGPLGGGHRMTQRFDDRLFQPAQWYPRVAKYDDLRGWDTNIYLGPSEFYNNFGRFAVNIDVPTGWIVTGTGVLQNPKEVYTAAAIERLSHVLESDEERVIIGADDAKTATMGNGTRAGSQTWRFVADQVNDFAWASSKDYILKATRATIPGKGPIPIYIVHLPERANRFQNAGAIARHALEFYSKLWAPYPFPQFTMQDGPNDGMEYPMVINSSSGPADHEAGHQWWPMMVGNNETTYGWMDEGFNQYMNILSDRDAGRNTTLNGQGQAYGRMSGDENEPIMMFNANYGGPGYSFQTYGKTPYMLSMLGGIVGDEAVQRAMSEYAKTWAFKHPSPWDYIFFMNGQLKQDLNWFWYYWLWTTEAVNGSIEGMTSAGGKTTVTVKQAGDMPSPVVLKVEFAADGPPIKPMANAKMAADGKSAIVTWPVDVWFNGSRTYQAVLDFGGRSITSVTLDPACRFPDRDPNDNIWPKPATPIPTAQRCGG